MSSQGILSILRDILKEIMPTNGNKLEKQIEGLQKSNCEAREDGIYAIMMNALRT